MTDTTTPSDDRSHVILVTGVSGAGKSSALKDFEDLGFEAVDNLPLSLFDRLLASGDVPGGLAIGVDVRTRDVDVSAFLEQIDRLRNNDRVAVTVLFMDCVDDILVRRFKETRRRHPLAVDRPLSEGIRRERNRMAALRGAADIVIDTSDMALGDLKRALEEHFHLTREAALSVFITTFGFRNGLPRDADLVFDVRFLKNPHYDPELRPLSGRDDPVGAYIETDPTFQPFFDKLTDLLDLLLGGYQAEGKSYLTIAVGCTGGRHRSVYTAERLARWFEKQGKAAQLRHRDLDKLGI